MDYTCEYNVECTMCNVAWMINVHTVLDCIAFKDILYSLGTKFSHAINRKQKPMDV